MMTIPANRPKGTRIQAETEREPSAGEGTFPARPDARSQRRRHSLRELLHGATPATMRDLAEATAWAREGDPVGREL